MAIPTVEELLVPALQGLGKGINSSAELAESIAVALQLPEAEKLELVPGSGQTVFRNRLAWALVWFGKAGLVKKLGAGRYELTADGKALLATLPSKLTTADLRAYPGFKYYKTGGIPPQTPNGGAEAVPGIANVSSVEPSSPMDQISAALAAHNAELESNLLAEIQAGSATDFERLVVRVLGRVLLPGSTSQRLHHVGKSGDGGIDGIIDEDALGLSRIYLQAKKYQDGNNVGVAEVHQFAGAMVERGAAKGVFVTSSDFTASARKAADSLNKSHVIRLVSGLDFVRMMIANGVGVREIQRVVLYGPDIAGLLAEA